MVLEWLMYCGLRMVNVRWYENG